MDKSYHAGSQNTNMLFNGHISQVTIRKTYENHGRPKMNLPIKAIITAAHKMGVSVFKIDGSNVYFKLNGTYIRVSLQTILEYGE